MLKYSVLYYLARSLRFFFGGVAADMNESVIILNPRPPSSARKRTDSFYSRYRIPRFSVQAILNRSGWAEILYSVIASASVLMIYKLLPFTVNIKPCQAMSVIILSIYSYFNVSIPMVTAGYSASLSSGTRYKPSKKASFVVIRKKFSQAFCGKIRLIHEAILRLIGQGPDRDSQSLPAPSFYREFDAVATCCARKA